MRIHQLQHAQGPRRKCKGRRDRPQNEGKGPGPGGWEAGAVVGTAATVLHAQWRPRLQQGVLQGGHAHPGKPAVLFSNLDFSVNCPNVV